MLSDVYVGVYRWVWMLLTVARVHESNILLFIWNFVRYSVGCLNVNIYICKIKCSSYNFTWFYLILQPLIMSLSIKIVFIILHNIECAIIDNYSRSLFICNDKIFLIYNFTCYLCISNLFYRYASNVVALHDFV